MSDSSPGWSFAKRLLFWCSLSYFLLYTFPFPVDSLPTWAAWEPRLREPEVAEEVEHALERWDEGVAWVASRTTKHWDQAVVWAADRFDAVEVTARPRGSGDTTFNYVQDGLRLAAALLLGLLASSLFRKRVPPSFLRTWLLIGARYYLAFYLVGYGLAKVIKAQFPYPRLERLIQPYGESSPMGIVWTFMGVSAPYNWFTGLGEVLAGALLLFRRTTTLGALVSIAVLANVAMLNYAYDVPVKLFSTNLLLFACALAAVDGRRLAGVFLLNRSTGPQPLRPYFSSKIARAGLFLVKAIVVTHVVWTNVDQAQVSHDRLDGQERPELYGIWEVTRFQRDGVELPPLETDATRWRRLIVDLEGWRGELQATIHDMTGGRHVRSLAIEEPVPPEVERKLLLGPVGEEGEPDALLLDRSSETELALSGVVDGSIVVVEMTRKLPEDFLLMNRGYHWVNETPYNR